MIGKTIRRGGSHYKIIEKLGEGGPVHRSSYYNHRSIK